MALPQVQILWFPAARLAALPKFRAVKNHSSPLADCAPRSYRCPVPDISAMFLPAGLPAGTACLLIALSALTSAMTAAFGIGGGVAMLGGLAWAAPPSIIIAVHGVVQFGSNIGRTIVQRDAVIWRLVWLFLAGSLAGVTAGAWLVTSLPARWLLGGMGAFILLMTWLPQPRIPGLARQGIVIGGAIASLLSMFVGAVGPFVQALLLPLGLAKRPLIATHSAMQTLQHALKVAAFGFAGVSIADWLPLALAMIASGFAGTVVGTKLLDRMPERHFRAILNGVLTLVALDLLRRAILSG